MLFKSMLISAVFGLTSLAQAAQFSCITGFNDGDGNFNAVGQMSVDSASEDAQVVELSTGYITACMGDPSAEPYLLMCVFADGVHGKANLKGFKMGKPMRELNIRNAAAIDDASNMLYSIDNRDGTMYITYCSK